LGALADLRIRDEVVEIRGYAKCVIDQMLVHARVSSSITQTLNRRAQKLASCFGYQTWVWVPRRENRHADGLSRRSFRFLHYSAYLKQEVNDTESVPFGEGRFASALACAYRLRNTNLCSFDNLLISSFGV
jgi:reverse transcriptase-like protein